MTIYSNNAFTAPASALNEMLRLYCPSVQKRVYPPGIRQDAQMPRINIEPMSPKELRVGIGEKFGSNMGLFYLCSFRVVITDNDANQVEKVAGEVAYAVWKHRGYVPVSSTDGVFLLLETAGGSPCMINPGLQKFQRVINVAGRWLSKSSESW